MTVLSFWNVKWVLRMQLNKEEDAGDANDAANDDDMDIGDNDCFGFIPRFAGNNSSLELKLRWTCCY